MHTDLNITKHALRRIGQRGITKRFLNALLENADGEVRVGGGVTALRVTSQRAQSLNLDDNLHRYAALVSEDGALISIIPMHQRRGRSYRRAA